MTFTHDQINSLPGTTVRDSNGELIGTVVQVWADTAGQPTWVGVDGSLMPLPGSSLTDGHLRTPYDRAVVKAAPAVDVNSADPMASNGLQALFAHYSLNLKQDSTDDGSMVRSEERLNVETRVEETDRVRLRKYVVTEYVTTTVPVRREEVRLERVPVGEADAGPAEAGTEVSESEHEIVLYAERPVVTTETVPVERVRLGKETVTEQQTVTGEVRKERIEADLPGSPPADLG